MLKQFQNLQKNQNDPKKIIADLTSKYTPEQMNGFIQFANGYGISSEQLENYGIKGK